MAVIVEEQVSANKVVASDSELQMAVIVEEQASSNKVVASDFDS